MIRPEASNVTCYDLHTIMHLSMLSPRVGGGQTLGNLTFNHFHESQSQIPHPWAPRKCQIPTPRYHFLPKTGLSYVKFPTPGQGPNVKIPTHGKARRINLPWVARHPAPLGLNIDRCITRLSSGCRN